jgi:hypothetical protein
MKEAAKKRLKVYRTALGFHESVVAAPNQRAALDAWGVSQNLFAEGAAEVEKDAAAVEAALAAPGQPLRRPLGSTGAYRLDPEPPDTSKGKARTPAKKVDRRKLDAAQAALEAVEARQASEAEALRTRRSELEADEARAEARWNADHKAAEANLRAARDAYKKAGGR